MDWMEEKAMEDKMRVSFGEHSWSASGGYGRSSAAGGELNRRKKKFVAPRCWCGAYAILFQSSTSDNPNRLFFGCSNFKTKTPHCKYFDWLDEYVSSVVVHEAANRVEVLEDLVKLEQKIVTLKKMIAEKNVGNRGNLTIKCWGFVFFMLGIVFSIGLVAALRV